MNRSYRENFSDTLAAEQYEKKLLGARYASLLWEIEKEFLSDFLSRHPEPENLSYLDFACGTGRIIAHLEDRVGSARGVEISEAMLDLARPKVSRADLVCTDISEPGVPVEGTYDLITAFRFFLNAEPALRLAVMKALAARLKDGRSRLIFNVQASVPSHKSVLRLLSHAGVVASKDGATHNFLSSRSVRYLLAEADLELEETFGYDMLSGKSLRLLPYEKVQSVEESLAGTRVAALLGGHRIYVARPRLPRRN